MRTLKLAGATAATGFALTMLASPHAQAAPAVKAAVVASATHHATIRCGKGLGGNKTVKFHWSAGFATTKIFFTNDCTKRKTITATVVVREYGYEGRVSYLCLPLNTHGQTHGNKKFGLHVYTVLRGSPRSTFYC
ncbi:MAG: hypothetical protein JWN52_476 [Actinomycetia bacterium]|nr:hypothetical protein [Actinomycetes bacterium]